MFDPTTIDTVLSAMASLPATKDQNEEYLRYRTKSIFGEQMLQNAASLGINVKAAYALARNQLYKNGDDGFDRIIEEWEALGQVQSILDSLEF
jgi:hypothetical protein